MSKKSEAHLQELVRIRREIDKYLAEETPITFFYVGDMVEFKPEVKVRDMWRGLCLVTAVGDEISLLNDEGDGTSAAPNQLNRIRTAWE